MGLLDIFWIFSMVSALHRLASLSSEGRWTHDYPIGFQLARDLGFPVSVEMPKEVFDLMELCPQPKRRTPSVE